jgi:hypothetical protein
VQAGQEVSGNQKIISELDSEKRKKINCQLFAHCDQGIGVYVMTRNKLV